MKFIGDLERFFVDVIWPVRVPLAISLVVGLVALVYVAWRRGWIGVARAHPGTSIVIVLLVLVIGGPIGWILGSPLFIRTELIEPTPMATVVSSNGSGATLKEGVWSGADDFHFGSGNASLVETDAGLVLSLDDFSVQNGPDLFVYVSSDPDGWNEEAVNLGVLKATDGSFSYAVPDGVSADDIASAVVWCKAFGVLFATAPLMSVAA